MSTDNLIPDSVCLDDIKTLMGSEAIHKSMWQYVGNSTEDIIETANILEKNNMLNEENIASLVTSLSNLTGSGDAETTTIIIDQILYKGLSGTVSNTRVMMKLISELLNKRKFRPRMSHFLNKICQILFWDLPTQERMMHEIADKPIRAKLHYLNTMIPKLETAIRKVQRAAFVGGILFLTNLGNGCELITKTIRDLTPWGTNMSLLRFHIVCTIISTITEESINCGYSAPALDPTLTVRLHRQMDNFLRYFESVNEKDRLEHVHQTFRRAFQNPKELKFGQSLLSFRSFSLKDDEKKDNKKLPESDDELILLRHYGKLYKVQEQLTRKKLASSTPSSSGSKETIENSEEVKSEQTPAADWQTEFLEIPVLLYYGLADSLPHLLGKIQPEARKNVCKTTYDKYTVQLPSSSQQSPSKTGKQSITVKLPAFSPRPKSEKGDGEW